MEELRTRIYRDIAAELKTYMVPDFLQYISTKSIVKSASSEFPTRLGDLMRKSLGEDGEQFLSAISLGYKALAEYGIDIHGIETLQHLRKVFESYLERVLYLPQMPYQKQQDQLAVCLRSSMS